MRDVAFTRPDETEDGFVTYNPDTGHTALLCTTGVCGIALVTWFVLGALRRLWRVYRFGATVAGRNLALAVFIWLTCDYFVGEIVGGVFSCSMVAPYLLVLAVGIKADRILSESRPAGLDGQGFYAPQWSVRSCSFR